MFAVLGAWALWAIVDIVAARHALLVGRSQAQVARTETSPTALEQATPVSALNQASAQFHQAKAHLDSPSLFVVRYLPVIGRQIQSARALAGAGGEAADAIAEGLTSAHALLATHPTGGPARVAQLQRALTIAGATGRRLRRLDYGPGVGLIASLAQAHNQLARDVSRVVNSLDRATSAGQSLSDLLSGNHRVLVLATNNAEMRAGSGMALELGILQVSDGSTQLQTISSVHNFPVPLGAVTAPPDLASRWGWLHPTSDWDELLNSPRFDMTAPTAAQMWQAAGQPPVDAVMALDPVFLADMVGVTGPITVGNQTYFGSQIVPYLLHDQYATASEIQRQDQSGALARAAFARFDAGGWSLTAMIQALAKDVKGRDVMMWSRSPADEAGWVRGGVAGLLTSQSLMVNIQNRGQNKLDWFLASSSTLSVVPHGQESQVAVTVHLDNKTPPGQPDAVIGVKSGVEAALYPGQPFKPGDYVGIVELSAPSASKGLTVDAMAEPPVNGPDGPTKVVAAQYIVRQGSSLDIKFSFTLAGTVGTIRVEPGARFPAMTWAYGTASWTGDHQRVVSW